MTDLGPNQSWRERLAVPAEQQRSGFQNVYTDETTGVHAHHQGMRIANQVLRVKDLLEAHYAFGCACVQSESNSFSTVDTVKPTSAEILRMEHKDVIQILGRLVPPSEKSSAVFTRIEIDAPFARHMLCGVVSMNYISKNDQDRIHDYIQQLTSLAARFKSFASNSDLFRMDGVEHTRDDDFRRLRAEHRRLFIEIAAFLEGSNWFSPSQFSSVAPSKGANQPAVRPGSDYGRSYPELLRILESRFSEERRLPPDVTSVSLVGSGLQALNTALGVVEKIAADNPPRPVLAQSGIYWECDDKVNSLVKTKWVSEVTAESALTTQQLINKIIEKKPRLVVAAPIGNSPDMPVIDVKQLLSTISSREFAYAWHGVTGERHPGELIVLLDNTVLSSAAQWTNFDFSRLPSWCVIGSIESMIKLRQDGFDSAPSGSLTWYGQPSVVEWLNIETASVRARGGYTPPPSTLFRLLLAPTDDYSEFRTRQHFLNSRILIDGLDHVIGGGERSLDGRPPIRFEVVTARKDCVLPLTSRLSFDDRDAPIFFIKVSDTSVDEWQKYFAQRDGTFIETRDIRGKILSLFISSLLDEARGAGVNLHEGTSFGFDETRVSLIGTDAVRVAPGIEHLERVMRLKNLFLTSTALLSARLLNSDLFQSSKEINMRFPSRRMI